MSDKRKFIVTGRLGVAVGSVVELTDAQAKHPLYRNRVRPADVIAELEVATPKGKAKSDTKPE